MTLTASACTAEVARIAEPKCTEQFRKHKPSHDAFWGDDYIHFPKGAMPSIDDQHKGNRCKPPTCYCDLPSAWNLKIWLPLDEITCEQSGTHCRYRLKWAE